MRRRIALDPVIQKAPTADNHGHHQPSVHEGWVYDGDNPADKHDGRRTRRILDHGVGIGHGQRCDEDIGQKDSLAR